MGVLKSIYKKQYDLIATPCLVEGESYAIRSRKLGVIFLSVICANAFLGIPVNIAVVFQDYNVGSVILIFTLLHLVICMSIIPYLYLRKTKHLSQGMVDFQIWSAFPGLISMILFCPEIAASMGSAILALTAVILQSRGLVPLIALMTFLNIFYILRQDYEDEVPALQIFMRKQLWYEKATAGIGNLITPVIFLAVGLHKIIEEFVQRSREADAAILMNISVADKLRLYDTDGVAEILAAHEGIVDPKLLRAFTAIQHNLQEYRPHIPDYVITATTAEAASDEASGGGGGEDDEGDLLGDAELNSYYSASSAGESNKALDKMKSTKSIKTHESPHSITSEVLERRLTTGLIRTQSSQSIVSSGSSPTPSCRAPDAHQAMRHNSMENAAKSGAQQRASTLHFTGKVTTVFIRFVSKYCGSDAGGNGAVPLGGRDVAISILNKCIEVASKHAKIHGGALQYMQGCGLMVSFNAASRVGSHEVKAAAFATSLRDEINISTSHIVLHASIVTSHALSFFAGNRGQLMLTLLGNYMPIHSAIHYYMCQMIGGAASCVLVTSEAASNMETRAVLRPLGAIHALYGNHHGSGSAGESGTSVLYEAISLRSENPDDEWMYQLAHQENNDPNAPIRAAVALAVSGRHAEAVNVLSTLAIDSGTTTTTILTRVLSCDKNNLTPDVLLELCLHRRLRECLEGVTEDFAIKAPPLPVHMW